MWLKKAAISLENALSPVMIVTGRIGSVFIPVIMFITVIDVVGRRVFNKPLTSAYELTALLLTIAVFFTITHCEFVRGHVTIDIAVDQLGKRAQHVINSVMYLFFLGTFILITRQLFIYALTTWNDHLTAGTLQVPVYPFTYLSAIGTTLLCFIVLAHFLLYVARAIGRQ